MRKWKKLKLIGIMTKLIKKRDPLHIVKLYNLMLDKDGSYHLCRFDNTKDAFIEIDSHLDLFALTRLLNQQDHDLYPKIKKPKI